MLISNKLPLAGTQVAALEAEGRDASKATPARTLADLSAADPWAALPTAAELLPEIVRLWAALHVPLLARSQFLIGHAGREPYYYMAEHAHLAELQRCALPASVVLSVHYACMLLLQLRSILAAASDFAALPAAVHMLRQTSCN